MNRIKYRTLSLSISLSILLTWLNIVHASPWYLDVKTGICNPKTTDNFRYESPMNTGIELGYRHEAWRFGLQMDYRQFCTKNNEGTRPHPLAYNKKSRSYILSGMVNIYRDFSIASKWHIYLGGGLGVARYRIFTFNYIPPLGIYVSDAKKLFTWQAMAGISFKLTEAWTLSTGYRYVHMANFRVDNTLRMPGLETKIKTPPPIGLWFDSFGRLIALFRS